MCKLSAGLLHLFINELNIRLRLLQPFLIIRLRFNYFIEIVFAKSSAVTMVLSTNYQGSLLNKIERNIQ